MIAIDTNILVYAHRGESAWHKAAYSVIAELAEGERLWAIPWSCLFEFYAIVTHPKIYRPPTPSEIALQQIDYWVKSPTLKILSETDIFWPSCRELISKSHIVGPQVHDGRVAAICEANGVSAVYTADRDFSRFGQIKMVNPLLREVR